MIIIVLFIYEQRIRVDIALAERVNAEAIIVPLFVGGMPQADTYFKMIDIWTDRLIQTAENKGLINKK